MSAHFDEIYAQDGAPSIPPETLLKAKVLQALYTVRSDRQLCARLQTDLMFRWFVDLPLDEEVFDATVFSKHQERLLTHQVADLFGPTTKGQPRGPCEDGVSQAGESPEDGRLPALCCGVWFGSFIESSR